jgi:hypothetical protein
MPYRSPNQSEECERGERVAPLTHRVTDINSERDRGWHYCNSELALCSLSLERLIEPNVQCPQSVQRFRAKIVIDEAVVVFERAVVEFI